MSYKLNPFTGKLDLVGDAKLKDLDTDKLEPVDSARKQIHLGGESTLVDLIAPGASFFAAQGDGVNSGLLAQAYGNGIAPVFFAIRGQGTKASPTGVNDGDTLLQFAASGYTANGTNGVFLGQIGGLIVTAAGAPTNTTIPMSIQLTTPDGSVMRTWPGRLTMFGSGSKQPTETLSLTGRLELDDRSDPTAEPSRGKLWYNEVDKTLYFMDGDGTKHNLTSGGSSTNGFEYQDYEKTGTYVYVGYEHSDGGWYIYRRTLTTNAREYASGSSGYDWSSRAGLTYT